MARVLNAWPLVLFLAALAPAAARAEGTATSPAAKPAGAPAPPQTWRDRMFFGGGVGLGFGDVDYVSIEPLVGWRLHPQVSVGTSLLYRWTNDDRYSTDVSTSDYGVRGFLQYFPVPQFFGQVEYEFLNYEYVLPNLDTDRDRADSLFLGGGISQPMGGKASFYASALYNVSYDGDDPSRPYDSPWVFRVGVAAGF